MEVGGRKEEEIIRKLFLQFVTRFGTYICGCIRDNGVQARIADGRWITVDAVTS